MVEVRLGMALILKRYKKEITSSEIKENSKNVYDFVMHFEFNFENIYQLVE